MIILIGFNYFIEELKDYSASVMCDCKFADKMNLYSLSRAY